MELLYAYTYFIVYAFLGWVCEDIYCGIGKRKFINRGFLYGPYCPIYGFGALLVIYPLLMVSKHPIVVFIFGMVLTSILEYITSFVMEKLFATRWWDYSNHRFNIEGRVCLFNAFLFGLGGIAFTYVINPFVVFLLSKLSITILRIISLIFFTIFIIDVVITIRTLYQVKVSTIKFKSRDVTAEITKLIREELTKKRDIKTNFFVRHMLNAFPWINLSDYNNPLSKLKRYSTKGIKKKQK